MLLRRVLFDKLNRLPEWCEFREDFEAATGLTLRLVDNLGRCSEAPAAPDSPLCRLLSAHERGVSLCGRFRQSLLESASQAPALAVCDAGLREVAVPIRLGGEPVGYFVFGGFRSKGSTEWEYRRARHLLPAAGLRIEPASLQTALDAAPALETRTAEALVRFVQMAVRMIADRLTQHLEKHANSEAPEPVRKACALIRQEALLRDIGLAETARRCGISEGHLSRSFHRALGLTFSEFVTRFRCEHARTLLADRSKNITEISRLSGFGSLSQFHRAFRRVFGQKPTSMRKELFRSSSGNAYTSAAANAR